MDIILASKSPRRRELLAALGFKNFKIIPADGEEAVSADVPPGEAVRLIAGAKAGEVAAKCADDDLIIAADTLVYHDGVFLGKPTDENDARKMLRRLSGHRHTVYSGVALIWKGRKATCFDATDVYFRKLSNKEIEWYVSTGEPMDKAGSYGAQGPGALLVERIEGDFFNVMGFPLVRFYELLREIGFPLLTYLSKGEDFEKII